MKRIIPAVKGTRDFYPEQMAVRSWLYRTARKVSESFGYQEYEAPMLETLALYAARSGDELVSEQAYVFNDRGGDQIALRPELTASLARMIAQKQGEIALPARWWSFGPFWRYERPQRGRTREFFQWNVDMLGTNSPEADAENVAVLVSFLREVGLKADMVSVLVNDRRLVDARLLKAGVESGARAAVSLWVDRRAKMSADGWKADGAALGLAGNQISEVEAWLADKDGWKGSRELSRFFAACRSLGIEDYVQFDASIVRGLTYYTGTVFEAWEVGGDIRRSLLGGGRYDNLLQDVGGAQLPAVGFAMGDLVMTLLLEKYGLLPADLLVFPARIFVTLFDGGSLIHTLELAAELRRAGFNVIAQTEEEKLAKQFKYADRVSARLVLVTGPDEIAGQAISVKDLKTGAQQLIRRSELIAFCKRTFETSQA